MADINEETIKDLISIFENANEKLIAKDLSLFNMEVSERNLCGALMLRLRDEIKNTQFSEYYADIEYNRNGGEIKTCRQKSSKNNGELIVLNISCDLIVHSRGENIKQDNLIAIEMKKSDRPQKEKDDDRERIIALTKDSFDDVWSFDGKALPPIVCRYGLGIYYEINFKSRIILLEYYIKGRQIDCKNIGF